LTGHGKKAFLNDHFIPLTKWAGKNLENDQQPEKLFFLNAVS
jgi:hypothetical protein